MKLSKIITATLLTMMLSTPTFAKNVELHNAFTDEQLVEIFKEGGYAATNITEKGAIQIKINGRLYMVYNSTGDGDLVSYYGISGVDVDEKDINEWNRTRRLSRAYIDEEHDPVIESDLLTDAGVSKSQVKEFLRIFVSSVDSFRSFIDEHDH